MVPPNLGTVPEEGRGMFNDIKLHWTVHPDRDQSWRDEQDELLGLQGENKNVIVILLHLVLLLLMV